MNIFERVLSIAAASFLIAALICRMYGAKKVLVEKRDAATKMIWTMELIHEQDIEKMEGIYNAEHN